MTKALEKELEDLENEEEAGNADQASEEETEETQEEADETDEGEDSQSEDEGEEEKELSEEEKEKLAKQEAYHKRREEKERKMREQREAARKADEQAQAALAGSRSNGKAEDNVDDEVRQFIREQKLNRAINAAERELTELEAPFKEAFTDYDDVVNEALELSKMRLVKQGIPASEADEYLRREKVMIADKAAAHGRDPVEAVYKEAKDVVALFEDYAEKKGYTKGRKKTNLQTQRDISRPNAMTGGRDAKGIKSDYKDMEADEVDSLTLGQMRQMQERGELV